MRTPPSPEKRHKEPSTISGDQQIAANVRHRSRSLAFTASSRPTNVTGPRPAAAFRVARQLDQRLGRDLVELPSMTEPGGPQEATRSTRPPGERPPIPPSRSRSMPSMDSVRRPSRDQGGNIKTAFRRGQGPIASPCPRPVGAGRTAARLSTGNSPAHDTRFGSSTTIRVLANTGCPFRTSRNRALANSPLVAQRCFRPFDALTRLTDRWIQWPRPPRIAFIAAVFLHRADQTGLIAVTVRSYRRCP